MEILFFIAMLCLLGYVVYRNITLISRYRQNKEYIECYKDMLHHEDGSYERVCAYIENEKSEEFKNKGRVLKIYQQLDNEEDLSDTLNQLDLKEIFYKNGKYVKSQMAMNNDVFIWFYLDLAKARRLSKFDVLDSLNEQFKQLEGMDHRVEYHLSKAIYNALCEKEDAGVEFLSSMLDGGFAQYEYEKNLIGLFKRFASATLAYSGEPMEDYYKNDLHSFAATAIGAAYMKDLEIYEKYLPLSDQQEETKEPLEENEEK